MPTGHGEPRLITDPEKIREAKYEWDRYEDAKIEFYSGKTEDSFSLVMLEPKFTRRSVEYYESPSASHRTKPFIVDEDIKRRG